MGHTLNFLKIRYSSILQHHTSNQAHNLFCTSAVFTHSSSSLATGLILAHSAYCVPRKHKTENNTFNYCWHQLGRQGACLTDTLMATEVLNVGVVTLARLHLYWWSLLFFAGRLLMHLSEAVLSAKICPYWQYCNVIYRCPCSGKVILVYTPTCVHSIFMILRS